MYNKNMNNKNKKQDNMTSTESVVTQTENTPGKAAELEQTNKAVAAPARRGAMVGMGGGRVGMPGQKPKNFKESFGKLLLMLKPYLPAIIVAIALAVAGTVFSIIGPRLLGEITDTVKEGIVFGIDFDVITRIAVTLVILYGLNVLFQYTQGFIMATVSQRTASGLRRKISKKINRLPLKYFDTNNFGDILSRVTNDVDTIGQTLNQSITLVITSVVMLVGVLIAMFITNWIMAFAAVGATLVGFVAMTAIIKRSQKHFITQQQSLGEMNGHIEEIYSAHNIVKVFNGTKEAKQKFDKINTKLYSSAWKSQFFSGIMMPIMQFVGNFGYVAICVVGAVLVSGGHIELGVITSFMIYVRLFSNPLSQIAQAATALQSASAASERVFEFLEEKELEDESGKTEKLDLAVRGDVEFKNVRFGYDPEHIIINDFSASVRSGQKIAIVGPTGAGKTTMVNLLMRFYETNSGNITIDGMPIKNITRENVHSLFGMVLQDTWLFEGTIMENIKYAKKDATDKEAVAACKAVGINHFIKTLPDGYNTVLNDKTSISQGQKQLITIARAMVQNAPMLILDEATSSVDTRTEILIQKAMDKLMAGRTSFVIAHRLSTIKNADTILVMKQGDIIEKGSHDRLLEQKGFYAELYNSQFGDGTTVTA